MHFYYYKKNKNKCKKNNEALVAFFLFGYPCFPSLAWYAIVRFVILCLKNTKRHCNFNAYLNMKK